jgi:hypothetical protein
MMTVTLGTIRAAEPALKKLLTTELPIGTSFKLSKLVKIVDENLQHYENERVKLVKKFGKADDQGNINVQPDQMDEFLKGITELHAISVELPYEPVSVESLGEVKMSAVDAAQLTEFLS